MFLSLQQRMCMLRVPDWLRHVHQYWWWQVWRCWQLFKYHFEKLRWIYSVMHRLIFQYVTSFAAYLCVTLQQIFCMTSNSVINNVFVFQLAKLDVHSVWLQELANVMALNIVTRTHGLVIWIQRRCALVRFEQMFLIVGYVKVQC